MLQKWEKVGSLKWLSLNKIKDVEVCIVATGFSSRVLTGRLFDDAGDIICLDIGSVSDMLVSNTEIFDNIKHRSTVRDYKEQIEKSLEVCLNDWS